MRVILFILSIVAFLAGVGILAAAQSAIHEIEGFVLFLISAVFIDGAAIVEAVSSMSKKLEEAAAIHTRLLTAIGTESKIAQENLRDCPFCHQMNHQEATSCRYCYKELSQSKPAGTDPDTIPKRPETEAETQEPLGQKRDILLKEVGALVQQYRRTNDPALLPRIKELRKQIESAK